MAKFDSARHYRRSIRLKDYDYTQAGAYFLTLCAWQRECIFGEILNDEMRLNEAGRVVARTWEWLADQYPYVELDAWVVMPNHLHGIMVIVDDNPVNGGRGGSQANRRFAPPYGFGICLGSYLVAERTISQKPYNR